MALEQDINFAFAIYGDPEVMRLIRPPAPDLETLKTTLTKRIEEAEQLPKGGGFWAVVEKLTDEVIGGAVLQPLPDRNHQLTEDYEIGWQLRRQSWGKGYATEFGKTLMEYGFKTLQLPYLLAVVHPENGRLQADPTSTVGTQNRGTDTKLISRKAGKSVVIKTNGSKKYL